MQNRFSHRSAGIQLLRSTDEISSTEEKLNEKKSDFNFPVFYLPLRLRFALILSFWLWAVTGGNISCWNWMVECIYGVTMNRPNQAKSEFTFLSGGRRCVRLSKIEHTNRAMKAKKAYKKNHESFCFFCFMQRKPIIWIFVSGNEQREKDGQNSQKGETLKKEYSERVRECVKVSFGNSETLKRIKNECVFNIAFFLLPTLLASSLNFWCLLCARKL